MRTLKLLIVILIFIFLSIPYLTSEEDDALITYYSEGKNKFKVKPISAQAGYRIRLTGSSQYKYIWFQFRKGTQQRDIKLILEDKKNFNYYYYLKDGVGQYDIYIFGANSPTSRYSGLCYFTINSLTNLPYKLVDLNINDKIIEYIDSVMGKRVGRGECWDLLIKMRSYLVILFRCIMLN